MAGKRNSKRAQGPAMMSRGGAQRIEIRDLKSIDDLSQLIAVEKEVWGMADEDALPLTLAIACKAAGNIFVGAFDNDKEQARRVRLRISRPRERTDDNPLAPAGGA